MWVDVVMCGWARVGGCGDVWVGMSGWMWWYNDPYTQSPFSLKGQSEAYRVGEAYKVGEGYGVGDLQTNNS